jgi:hypothetical protein
MQAVAPHTYGVQLTGSLSTQLPEPLQAETESALFCAGSQLAGRHSVPLAGKAHALRFAGSQLPLQLEPSPAHAVREPTGAPLTPLQVPARFATLQASHWPLHGALQHTPSTQYGLLTLHSPLFAQGLPAPTRGWQLPIVQ